MVNPHYYTSVSAIEHSRPLWEGAVLLAERQTGYRRFELYQQAEDYIEVCWHRHFNVVVSVCRFQGTDRLQPYLDAIAIDHLLA